MRFISSFYQMDTLLYALMRLGSIEVANDGECAQLGMEDPRKETSTVPTSLVKGKVIYCQCQAHQLARFLILNGKNQP